MARKPKFEGGTKNRILEVASHMFFENGFDGTSVRGIMSEVGGEIGLFYYYYKSKDDLFTNALDNFFEPYRKDFAIIVGEAKESPYRAFWNFFVYVKNGVREFRSKYANNIHRTVKWAIREQTLTVIEPYIEEMVNVFVEFGAKPKMDAKMTAVFLAHGIGSVLLHDEKEWDGDITGEVQKAVNLIMGFDEEATKKMFEVINEKQ